MQNEQSDWVRIPGTNYHYNSKTNQLRYRSGAETMKYSDYTTLKRHLHKLESLDEIHMRVYNVILEEIASLQSLAHTALPNMKKIQQLEAQIRRLEANNYILKSMIVVSFIVSLVLSLIAAFEYLK